MNIIKDIIDFFTGNDIKEREILRQEIARKKLNIMLLQADIEAKKQVERKKALKQIEELKKKIFFQYNPDDDYICISVFKGIDWEENKKINVDLLKQFKQKYFTLPVKKQKLETNFGDIITFDLEEETIEKVFADVDKELKYYMERLEKEIRAAVYKHLLIKE